MLREANNAELTTLSGGAYGVKDSGEIVCSSRNPSGNCGLRGQLRHRTDPPECAAAT